MTNDMKQDDKRAWVDVRRSALTDYYDLPAAQQATADQLFARMEALAGECADQGEFERRLAASPLTQEYNGLFASFAPYIRKDPEREAAMERQRKADARQSIIDNVRNQTRSAVLHELNNRVPIDDYKWGEPWYFAIPVVGPVIKRLCGAADQVESLRNLGSRIVK